MKNFFFFLLMAAFTTSMISCSGPKGDNGLPGSAGLDGVDGTNGQDGQDGQDGQNGQDGNANVKSQTISILYTDWIYFNIDISYIDFNVPIITADIAATGMVMAYLKLSSGETVALPLSSGNQQYNFWFIPGKLRLHTVNIVGVPEKFEGDIRIVAVSSSGLVRNPNLDWTNYNAVKAALNLSE